MRDAGNHPECQSCHLNAGTRQFGLPLTVWGVYPSFIGRENNVRTLEERINGCMERSMNGRALPVAGPEMKALHDYPDRSLEPADATYGPFVGPFPAEQHLKGPWLPIQHWLSIQHWLPIQHWQRDNAAQLKAVEGAAP